MDASFLEPYDPNKKIYVQTDAYKLSLRYVLYQMEGDNSERGEKITEPASEEESEEETEKEKPRKQMSQRSQRKKKTKEKEALSRWAPWA